MLFYFFERIIIINKGISNYTKLSRLAKIVANIHIKYIYEDTTKWINTHSIISL